MAADGEEALRELVHALRTPLTLVEGFADLLVRSGDDLDPADRRQHLQHIADAAREMRDLLDDAV